jgi:NAD+ diphosphatase
MVDLTFANGTFERAHLLRKSPQALADAWADPACQVVVSWEDLHLLDANGAAARVSSSEPWLSGAARLFLGTIDGAPVFAARLPPDAGKAPDQPTIQIPSPEQGPQLVAGALWHNLRSVGLIAPAVDAGLCATAQGLFGWHRRHAYCGLCGHPTESQDGGHLRHCTNDACAAPHFPRTDPAVIMLVRGPDDRILMGRQAAWPAGMLSTLAGFVEPGETLEQAVAREVMEETGIRVGRVTYQASQPWPFPSSLMLGFFAEAESSEIQVDDDELEMARWVSREEIATFRDSIAVEGDGPALPSPISISRLLINRWLQG